MREALRDAPQASGATAACRNAPSSGNSRTTRKDVDRTSTEGKASSVQFVHFNFTDKQIKKFRNLKNEIFIGIDHDLYNHMTKISEITRKALIKDFA